MINWKGLRRKRPWLNYAAILTFDCKDQEDQKKKNAVKRAGVPAKIQQRTFWMHVRSFTAWANSPDLPIKVGFKGTMDLPCAWPDRGLFLRVCFLSPQLFHGRPHPCRTLTQIALPVRLSGYTHVTRKIVDRIIMKSYTDSSLKNSTLFRFVYAVFSFMLQED
jgi:hypothetical protein